MLGTSKTNDVVIRFLYMHSMLVASWALVPTQLFEETSFIRGNKAALFQTASVAECAIRSLLSGKAKGFLYSSRGVINCHVIECGNQTFLPQEGDTVYAVESQQTDATSAVVYFHFEGNQFWTNHGAELIEESLSFTGHNTVVKTDLALQQWMDLGNLSQASITVPESCGTNGGTVTAWIRLLGCEVGGGIISSLTGEFSSFSISCWSSFLTVGIDQTDGWYAVDTPKPSGWTHVAMVYHGIGQGITGYVDGSQIGTDAIIHPARREMGTGQVVIGWRSYDGSGGRRYSSSQVDEIKMYNRQLSQEEIANMY